MKNSSNISIILLFILSGCAKEMKYQYDSVNRIYFQVKKQNSLGNMVPIDSVVFSFGKQPENIKKDTAKIAVQVMGDSSSVDRIYNVKVLATGADGSKTTMVEGQDYDLISPEQVFRAGRFLDTLRIVVYREHLSSSVQHPVSKTLMLKLEPSKDFKPDLPEGREMKLSLNNILIAPKWWKANEASFGFYHPKKWRILISLDPLFAVEDVFTGTGVDIQKKSGILEQYLNANVVIDDETGMRIKKTSLVPL